MSKLIHILENSMDINEKLAPHNWKIINYVAKYGKTDVLKYLIEMGADINSPCPHDKWTPIHQAANSGIDENVKLLVDSGVDLELVNNEGRTGWEFIKSNCNSETIEYCNKNN